MIKALAFVSAALCLQLLTCGSALAQGDLAGNWIAVSLNGNAVPASAEATLSVADGMVSGKSFCNRFSGKLEGSGSALKVGMLASTRMACPPAVMGQEQLFLAILTDAKTGIITGTNLTLMTDDGRTIGFRRP